MTDVARGGLTVEERKRLVEVIIDAAARRDLGRRQPADAQRPATRRGRGT